MGKPWWGHEKKHYRHEFRTTKKEEETLQNILNRTGKTITQIVLEGISNSDNVKNIDKSI